MREIDDTRGSSRDDSFEEVVTRIQSVATEFSDQENPHYIEIGDEEYEIGTRRTILFHINKEDYRLIRTTENFRLSGDGRQKHLEDNIPPKIHTTLHKKSPYDQNWQVIDLEDFF
ncbi:hypothetical protein KA119_01930 [Candidatus Gracilibacteria bacterium]|nr:hypothetical protein [Candidatus Gracilibacteria bacterium]